MRPGNFRNAIAVGAATALLTGCGPSVERAFSNCTELSYKQALSGAKGLLPKEVMQAYEKSSRAAAEKQCSIIRDECRRDPQADMCQRLVKQYGK